MMSTMNATPTAALGPWVEELTLEPDGTVVVLRAFTVEELDALVSGFLDSL